MSNLHTTRNDKLKAAKFLLPVLLSFPGDCFLLFETTGPAKPTVVQAIQSLLLRLLATIPPGKLRFTFLDPVGLGQNVAPFMHLADYDEALVTGIGALPRPVLQRRRGPPGEVPPLWPAVRGLADMGGGEAARQGDSTRQLTRTRCCASLPCQNQIAEVMSFV